MRPVTAIGVAALGGPSSENVRIGIMDTKIARAGGLAATALLLGILSSCGGGQGGNVSSSGAAPPASTQVSGASPLPAGCGIAMPAGITETYASGSGVQPQIASIPGGAQVAVWQQDRWIGLGARGILTARSTDGGKTWSAPAVLPFSVCGGGSGPGAAYDRASDPWITFAGNGVVVASALAFSANSYTGNGFGASSGASAVLVARSADGGLTWSTPTVVWNDPNTAAPFYFNDRDAVTADPASGNVYLVWDRISSDPTLSMPAYFASSTDGGVTWSAARVIYDPGVTTNGGTLGNEAFDNQIAVLPNGTLLDFFTRIDAVSLTPSLQVISSADHGATWSAPTVVADSSIYQPVGTTNPINGGPAIRDSALLAQVAVDPSSGNVAEVWQQMFNNNGAFDGIALSISTNSGATWSAIKQINGVKGVAAFNPTVRYLPGGVIAVTYYDLRDFVAGTGVLNTDVWLTESADGGTTWHEVRMQAPFNLNNAPLANLHGSPALFLGDNQGIGLTGALALPLYTATNSAGAHIDATQAPDTLTLAGARVYTASVPSLVHAQSALKRAAGARSPGRNGP